MLTNSAPNRAIASLGAVARRPYFTLAGLGHQATFVVRAFRTVPMTLRLYPGEVLRLLSDI
jgi:phospholipid/cholesterol/gamma-HCH transport system permease protein